MLYNVSDYYLAWHCPVQRMAASKRMARIMASESARHQAKAAKRMASSCGGVSHHLISSERQRNSNHQYQKKAVYGHTHYRWPQLWRVAYRKGGGISWRRNNRNRNGGVNQPASAAKISISSGIKSESMAAASGMACNKATSARKMAGISSGGV